MAPEIIRRKPYRGKATDVWSLGVLLFAMLAGKFPFTGSNQEQLYDVIMTGDFDFPHDISTTARSFISSMLVRDPRRRCSILAMRSHPWMKHQGSVPPRLPFRCHLMAPNPIDDVRASVLEIVQEQLGIPQDVLTKDLLERKHSCISTVYYLFLLRAETLRELDNKRQHSATETKLSSPVRPQGSSAKPQASFGERFRDHVNKHRQDSRLRDTTDTYIDQILDMVELPL